METEKSKIQASKDKYLKEKVDAFKLYFPKGQKDIVKNYAKSQGKSLNSYIIELIDKDMQEQQSKDECLV